MVGGLRERIAEVARELGKVASPKFEFEEEHLKGLSREVRKDSEKSIISLDNCTIPVYLRERKESAPTVLANDANLERAVILGEPGAGKSIFLKRRAILGSEDKIPVYIQLSDYDGSDLGDFIFEQIRQSGFDFALREMIYQGRFEFLFDGLDEVVGEGKREKLISELQTRIGFEEKGVTITGGLGMNDVIITSRPNTYQDLVGFRDFEVQPINKKDIQEFLRDMDEKTGCSYSQLHYKIKDDEVLMNMCTNPLLLGFVMKIFEDCEHDKEKEFNIENKAHLYDQIIETEFLGREEHEKGMKHRENALTLLSEIAFLMQTDEEIVKRNSGKITYDIISKKFNERFDNLDEILDSIKRSNLVLYDEERRAFEFIHPTLREYFCARSLVKKIEKWDFTPKSVWEKYLSYPESEKLWRKPIFSEGNLRGALPAWEQTCIFLAGMLDPKDMDDLMEELIKPYFEIKKEKTEDFIVMLGVEPSYSHTEDYNPFIYNLILARDLISNAKSAKPSKRRIDLYRPVYNELLKASETIGWAMQGDITGFAEKILRVLSPDKKMFDFIYSHSNIFDIRIERAKNRRGSKFRNFDDFVETMQEMADYDILFRKIKSVFESNLTKIQYYHNNSEYLKRSDSYGILKQIGTEESLELFNQITEILDDIHRKKYPDSYKPDSSYEPRVPKDYETAKSDLLKAIEEGKEEIGGELSDVRQTKDIRITQLFSDLIVSQEKYRSEIMIHLSYASQRRVDNAEDTLFKHIYEYPKLFPEIELQVIRQLSLTKLLTLYSDFDINPEWAETWALNLISMAQERNDEEYTPLIIDISLQLIEEVNQARTMIENLLDLGGDQTYVALAEYIKERDGRCENVLDGLEDEAFHNISLLEERTKAGLKDYLFDLLEKDKSKMKGSIPELLSKFGETRAIPLMHDFLEEVYETYGEKKYHNYVYARMEIFDHPGLHGVLRALPNLIALAKQQDSEINPKLFDVLVKLMEKTCQLQSFDSSLRQIDPTRFIYLMQQHMPSNYTRIEKDTLGRDVEHEGSSGPICASIYKAHQMLKPGGYVV